jgi:hypothetical protein
MFKVQVYPACLLEFLDPLLAAQEVDALVVQAALARVNALVTRVLLLAARAVDALVVRADGSPLARHQENAFLPITTPSYYWELLVATSSNFYANANFNHLFSHSNHNPTTPINSNPNPYPFQLLY